MSRWQSRAEDLLYDGESIVEIVDVDTARIVVTSHRVLAFTPEMDGANFRQVDRPNIMGVDTSALSESDLLERAIRYGIIGGVLVVTGVVFDFGDMLGDTDLSGGNSQELGLGGIMDLTQSLLSLMQELDQLLQIFGALALLLSAVLLGVYWFLRDPTLIVRLAGDDQEDIHLPRPADASAVRTRLEEAILPDEVVEPIEGEPTPAGGPGSGSVPVGGADSAIGEDAPGGSHHSLAEEGRRERLGPERETRSESAGHVDPDAESAGHVDGDSGDAPTVEVGPEPAPAADDGSGSVSDGEPASDTVTDPSGEPTVGPGAHRSADVNADSEPETVDGRGESDTADKEDPATDQSDPSTDSETDESSTDSETDEQSTESDTDTGSGWRDDLA